MLVKEQACRELGGDLDSKVLLVSVPSSGRWERVPRLKMGTAREVSVYEECCEVWGRLEAL